MFVSDLFIQGLFARDFKARFPQGLVGLSGPDDTRLADALETLLFSTGFDPMGPFATAQGEVKAGCVIVADDGTAYRLMRDLKNGGAQLAKAQGGQYAPLASTASDVTAVLQQELRFPTRDLFKLVFCIRAEDFDVIEEESGPKLAPSMLMLALPETRASRPAPEIKAELDKLKAQRTNTGGSVQQLEFELDGLQKKRFAFDEIKQKRSTLTDKIAAVERDLHTTGALDQLPPSFLTLAGTFEETKATLGKEKNRLLDEQRDLEAHGMPPQPQPLWQDAKFMAGVAVGVVILGASAFLDGDLRLLGLLDIAPFGLAAVQALGTVDDLEKSERYRQRTKLLADRLKKIEQKFESDTAVVRNAVKKLGADSAEDVVSAITRRNSQKVELVRLQEALTVFDQNEGAQLHGADLQALNTRISQLEDQLESLGMQSPQDAELDRRIGELERELKGGVAPSPAPSAAKKPDAPAPFLELLRALGDLGGVDTDAIAQQLGSRVVAYAERLLGPTTVQMEGNGDLRSGGHAWASLDVRTKHLLRLCVRFAAFELASSRHAFPLWIERLERLDTLPHDMLGTYYKHLAKRSQAFWLGGTNAGLVGADERVSVE